MTLFYAEGPSIVRELKDRGFKVFLDLKFHDIPHQVRGAARSAALAGADLMSVHGLGSGAMLSACREGAEEAAELRGVRPKLVAITVLTSMNQESLSEIGVESPVSEEADRLARLACANGIDGVVCSPREAHDMRQLVGESGLVVTPGVRPAGAELGDQSRVATPPRLSTTVPPTSWSVAPSPAPSIQSPPTRRSSQSWWREAASLLTMARLPGETRASSMD